MDTQERWVYNAHPEGREGKCFPAFYITSG
jgi:hypothetical protein